MGNTFESILTDLKLFVEEPLPTISRVLTCGKNLTDWSDGRLKSISQILLNAVVIPRSEFELRLERIQHQIEADLNKESIVKTLSYYFDDAEAMKSVTIQLAKHYGSDLNPAEVVNDMTSYSGKSQETIGFLLVTIIESHILQ
ncbi:hypothetical protein SAMN05421788_106262 [Filimonas lacunae]|uniref:Uncharacterized protein n=2 Tax=Filimonas lacunae TaxID=477680 RepID=A0A1N7QRU2_9BACT|nr:hypothetical protein [Filimonas lacunae]SIT25217.1 hypothetical protein SAMN05421788_106262 [Filimonas lacunae]